MDSAPRVDTGRRRATALGLLAALATGVVWSILSAIFNLHLGLIVLGAFGGWLIGSVVRPVGSRGWALAVAFAAVAWSVGSVLDFALSQLFLPGSSIPLADRLAFPRYFEFLAGTFDVVQALAIAILVLVAWRSAR